MSTSASSSNTRRLILPPAPATETGAVKAWRESVEMATYLPDAADVHPMYLDQRVYQGSSGKVYPLPVIDRIASTPLTHLWDAIHIENEYLRVMVMPEIGGRIHVGYDKTNGYDFFYRQNVIKPALVGLAGPWISGGVEFNWPQHHRPDTFMPTRTEIIREEDGSVTVWCSQHDPLSHMKGMHGVCLHPGKGLIELKVRLYNRTENVQTFLWWANAAMRVHEKYQSFFPPDVRYVADHARRAITSYPRSNSAYYGVDYPSRAHTGVPADEQPGKFRPDGSYAPDDLGWYANIPVPTSYMITSTKEDFFGGYDHAAQAGVVHVANHHIAPGKKQWTWGNHEFGYSWDRCLTDDDGPYIELMAGVYTDNQPDFSFLAPGETRTFSQFWYPIRSIGVPQAANLHGALSLKRTPEGVVIGVCVTEDAKHARIVLSVRGEKAAAWEQPISVAQPAQCTQALSPETPDVGLSVVLEIDGKNILQFSPGEVEPAPPPHAATEPLQPADIASIDELYLTAVHLQQYRHATRAPEPYWQEALRRDPGDSRCNTALGVSHLRRGDWKKAEEHLRTAIQRLTIHNSNPADGEAYYQLGLVLRYQHRYDEAYAAFFKATWNAAWRAPSFYALAEIDARRAKWKSVLEHTEKALQSEVQHMNGRSLRAVALRKTGRQQEANHFLLESFKLDPLDNWTNFQLHGSAPENGQERIDLAFDLHRAGLLEDLCTLLKQPLQPAKNDGSQPILIYLLDATLREMGDASTSDAVHAQAKSAAPQYCFPNRLDEMLLLQDAIRLHPDDTRAAFYLGTMLYDRECREEAIALWERVTPDDICYSIAQRNLGIAYFNVRRDTDAALTAYDRAFDANSRSARLLYERDQLWKRTQKAPGKRLAELLQHITLISQRDDLSVELATLLNQSGEPLKALEVLQRDFQPWEGGEGHVLAQYVRARLMLAEQIMLTSPADALQHLELAFAPPHSLGETFHLHANRSEIFYLLGIVYTVLGKPEEARHFWKLSSKKARDFQQMELSEISTKTYWSAKSLEALGDKQASEALFEQIAEYADSLANRNGNIDYFATSLPNLMLFHDDMHERNQITALLLRSQAYAGAGRTDDARRTLHELLLRDSNQMDAMQLLAHLDRSTRP